MFCNHCGAQLAPDSSFCRACGKPAVGVPTAAPMCDDTRFDRRLHVLAMFWIVMGALFFLPAITLFGVGHGFDFVNSYHGIAPFFPFASIFGGGFAILGLGGIFVGYGLMHHQPWARVAAIVLGIMFIFHPPFGTALGVFTLIVLLSHSGADHYARASRVQ